MSDQVTTVSGTSTPSGRAATDVDDDRPAVLVVTVDEGLAGTYRLWLQADHDVTTVTDPAAAPDRLDDSVGVVVASEAALEAVPELAERLAERDRLHSVVLGAGPDSHPGSRTREHLTRPVGRLDLCRTVERVRRRARYDRALGELYELARRRAAARADGGAADPGSREVPSLEEVEARIAALDGRLRDALGEFEHEDFRAVLSPADGAAD